VADFKKPFQYLNEEACYLTRNITYMKLIVSKYTSKVPLVTKPAVLEHIICVKPF
jgi:hypothetical protein